MTLGFSRGAPTRSRLTQWARLAGAPGTVAAIRSMPAHASRPYPYVPNAGRQDTSASPLDKASGSLATGGDPTTKNPNLIESVTFD